MQYKTLAALLFASVAIAAPAPDSSSTATSDSSDDSDYGYGVDLDSIPTTVMEYFETATAANDWANSMATDTAFMIAEASRLADGDFPAWVSSVPEAAQTYIEKELQAEGSAYKSYMAQSGTGALASLATEAFATETGSLTGSAATITKSSSQTTTETTTGSSSETATASESGSATGSKSAGSSTSTSTAGAPAATGGIAMSLAGAAGVLGLALAL